MPADSRGPSYPAAPRSRAAEFAEIQAPVGGPSRLFPARTRRLPAGRREATSPRAAAETEHSPSPGESSPGPSRAKPRCLPAGRREAASRRPAPGGERQASPGEAPPGQFEVRPRRLRAAHPGAVSLQAEAAGTPAQWPPPDTPSRGGQAVALPRELRSTWRNPETTQRPAPSGFGRLQPSQDPRRPAQGAPFRFRLNVRRRRGNTNPTRLRGTANPD